MQSHLLSLYEWVRERFDTHSREAGVQTKQGEDAGEMQPRIKEFQEPLEAGRSKKWAPPWCWEELGAGGEGDDRGWDGWMASPTHSMDVSLSELWEMVMDREAWRAVIHGVARSRTRLSNWTELNWDYKYFRLWKPCGLCYMWSLLL